MADDAAGRVLNLLCRAIYDDDATGHCSAGDLDDGGEAVVRPAVDFDKIKYVFVIDRSPAASAPAAATTPPRPEVAPQ